MHRYVAVLAIITACSRPALPPAGDITTPSAPSAPITDLRFNDERLQSIATRLTREARARGIETSPGWTRVDRLLALETSLGAPPSALDRVNALTVQMTATDVSQWALLRGQMEREFCKGTHDTDTGRVCDMLVRWKRHRSAAVLGFLSSNYTSTRIPSLEWELRFRDFLRQSPRDAATWGWLVLRDQRPAVQQQYGRADAETAYRFYLEFSGLGTGREARDVFSVPGVEMGEGR